MFVLEELRARARRRGAHVYAEIAGFASRCNAYHMTGSAAGRRGDGRGHPASRWTQARLRPRRRSTTSTRTAPAPSRTTGTRRPRSSAASGEHAYEVPVSSIKSMIGHSLGAIGSLEIAACALAIEHDVVPPTANLHEPDPECDLDYVPLTRPGARASTPCSASAAASAASRAPWCSAERRPRGDAGHSRPGALSAPGGRAVVTGIGVVAPNGVGTEALGVHPARARAASARSPGSTPPGYPSRLAGEVAGFDAAEHVPGPAAAADRPHDPAGARRRRRGAGRRRGSPNRGPTARVRHGRGHRQRRRRLRVRPARDAASCGPQGPDYVSAYQSFAWFYAVNTGQISIRHGMRGPGGVLVSEQAGGLDAIGQARRQLRTGVTARRSPAASTPRCARGAGSPSCSRAAGRTADDPAAPTCRSTPTPRGYVPGEGGAMLVAGGRRRRPARRGARGVRRDRRIRRHVRPARPAPDAPPGSRRAAELALADAGLGPERRRRGLRRRGRHCPTPTEAEAEALRRPLRAATACRSPRPRPMTGRLFAGGAAAGRGRRAARPARRRHPADRRHRPPRSRAPARPGPRHSPATHGCAPRWCWPAAAAASTPPWWSVRPRPPDLRSPPALSPAPHPHLHLTPTPSDFVRKEFAS